MISHSENPFTSAFEVSAAVVAILIVISLALAFPPLRVITPLLAAAYFWVIVRHPVGVLGAVLAFMPVDYMVIELGKFFGLPNMAVVSACTKEIPLLLLIVIFWRRNGFKAALPDWFLAGFLFLAAIWTVVDGTLVGLVSDIQFVVPYFLGRVAHLTGLQQAQWARRAVWIVALLSLLGMFEIFMFGPGPRILLYTATDGITVGKNLSPAFYAQGFLGMREASTMIGPPSFAALCMIALIIWWVYSRNLVLALMIGAGLICSVTRSSWLGTVLAILILGIAMGQQKRLLKYCGLGVMLFALAIPLLGLGDYLLNTRRGQDNSAESHGSSILTGLTFISEHPLGGGNARIGPRPSSENGNALLVETTYLAFGAEYGIIALLCFLGFMFSAFRLAWKDQSQIGYTAVGILIGLGLAMTVLILHDDRRLACWEWFPIGLAVEASLQRTVPFVSHGFRDFPLNKFDAL